MILIADKENYKPVEALRELIERAKFEEDMEFDLQNFIDEYLNLRFFLEQAKQRYSEELQEEESFEEECPYCDCEEEDENQEEDENPNSVSAESMLEFLKLLGVFSSKKPGTDEYYYPPYFGYPEQEGFNRDSGFKPAFQTFCINPSEAEQVFKKGYDLYCINKNNINN
jgi:hypothetical protein